MSPTTHAPSPATVHAVEELPVRAPLVSRALMRFIASAWAILASVSLVACGAPPAPAKSAAAPGHLGALHMYPLDPGTQWGFVVHDAFGGGPGLLAVTKVVSAHDGVALLATGSETTKLRVADDGIVREASGAYLLKWPARTGDKWPGPSGSTVEVTKTDARIRVEAGAFDGCLETLETHGGDNARVVRTTYCPEVGPVLLEVHATAAGPADASGGAVARLRSFGPPVDLGGKASAPSRKSHE